MAFRPGGKGAARGEFSTDEAEIIATLAAQVARLLSDRGRDADPAIDRLLPSAYPDDADAAAEFRRFTEQGLAERKVGNAQVVVATLGDGTGVELDNEAAVAWLRALTDIRLTLATRLGIDHDDAPGDQSSDAALAMRDVYDWLGYVQDSLVRAIEA